MLNSLESIAFASNGSSLHISDIVIYWFHVSIKFSLLSIFFLYFDEQKFKFITFNQVNLINGFHQSIFIVLIKMLHNKLPKSLVCWNNSPFILLSLCVSEIWRCSFSFWFAIGWWIYIKQDFSVIFLEDYLC